MRGTSRMSSFSLNNQAFSHYSAQDSHDFRCELYYVDGKLCGGTGNGAKEFGRKVLQAVGPQALRAIGEFGCGSSLTALRAYPRYIHLDWPGSVKVGETLFEFNAIENKPIRALCETHMKINGEPVDVDLFRDRMTEAVHSFISDLGHAFYLLAEKITPEVRRDEMEQQKALAIPLDAQKGPQTDEITAPASSEGPSL